MLQRLIAPPDQSFFLFGARGTGKSTWAKAAYPGLPYFDLLDQEAFISYQREPGRFGRQLAAIRPGETVVVDEIQRIPGLLNEVHRAIESNRQRFVLLGSSSRKLKRAGVNLLGGRASLRTLFPLLPSELGDQFDLEEALRYGTLPLVWASRDREETLSAYAVAYISEEIRAEGLARDLGSFLRFLPIAALFHGQTMNVSAVARDAGVPRTTVEGYFSILEDTLLAWRLPAFEVTPRVRERAHPKVFWIDAGVVRSLKGSRGPVVPEERGALLEGWVANVLRATFSYESSRIELSYLPRHGSVTEVDFIVKRDSHIVAIEVKASPHVDSRSLKGLRSIQDMDGLHRRILVCGVSRPERTEDGILILPFEHFGRHASAAELFED
jgi:uncharacterized protein